jgi:hypothetical protein
MKRRELEKRRAALIKNKKVKKSKKSLKHAHESCDHEKY